MRGFRRMTADGHMDGRHLVLAGPDVRGVSDDPEGARTLAGAEAAWRELPARIRERVHLASIPMDDVEENATIVNALQRHASVIVQKSLREGFGLTVTEAMWKRRPVVASAVGGIRDQIADGVSGLLLSDPRDAEGLADAIARVLSDAGLAGRLAEAGHAHVRERHLPPRHLAAYAALLDELVS
jgi:trehalose synthase